MPNYLTEYGWKITYYGVNEAIKVGNFRQPIAIAFSIEVRQWSILRQLGILLGATTTIRR